MAYVNCFSLMVQLLVLQKSDAHTMADRFLSMVVSQYGLLECIMSDHDPYFYGYFWDELMSLRNMTLTFSIVLNLQTDGMVQVTSCTMEQLLQIYM